MTSFAKVCIDLSNNLRNLRFSKSSPSNSTISANVISSPASEPELARTTNQSNGKHASAMCFNTGLSDASLPMADVKTNGTKPGSPILSPRLRHHHKKQAPPVPSNPNSTEPESGPIASSEVRPATSTQGALHPVSFTQSTTASTIQPTPDAVHSSPTPVAHRSPIPTTRYNHPTKPPSPGSGRPKPTNSGKKIEPNQGKSHRSAILVSTTNEFTHQDDRPGSSSIPPAPPPPSRRIHSTTTGHTTASTNTAPRTDEVINGVSPRFSPRLTFSPTMAQRVATLARSCQYNYTGSDASSVKSGTSSNCSSPVMPHRGATVAAIKQRLLSQGLKIDLRIPSRRFTSTRYRDYMRRVQRGRPATVEALWEDDQVLSQIFTFLTGRDLLSCCSVCQNWLHLIARLGCFDQMMITLNLKRLWTDTMREQVSDVSTASQDNPFRVHVTEENGPPSPTWMDQRLEQKLIQRLRAGVRRGIRTLNLVQMADRYAPLVLNAIMNVLYECDNPDTLRRKSVTKCEATGVRQPLAPVQSFTLSSPCSSHPGPSATGSMSTRNHVVDNETPRYFSPLTTGTPIISDVLTQDSVSASSCSERAAMNSRSLLGKSPIHLFTTLSLRCCSIVDSTMEQLVRLFPGLRQLEIQCCNELSELAFWTCLVPSIVHLSVFDCINVSDESVGAITQMLPDLKRLTLQAYHVTDAAFSYFSPKQRASLESVRLTQCMDVTNQGLINLAFALPSLVVLSVSGCTNLTDDGLEVICENLKQLRVLDLAWCAKITDNGMEFIANYLGLLQKLILDRCVSISDLGIGHLTVLPQLHHLSVRWCVNLSDGMMPHLLGLTRLIFLSIAGCKRVTEEGVCQLARHPRLRQLELTHCPGASSRVKAYLNENLPDCRLSD